MKYELTSETTWHRRRLLYRIRALKDFADVRAGDLGGYVQSIDNLSQEGNCWVYNSAYVYNNARVFGDARVGDYACVYDNAQVSGSAVINRSYVFGNAIISGMAVIKNTTVVDSEVGGFAEVTKSLVAAGRIMNPSDLELV